MNELDKQETEQIALVEAACQKAVQTIRDYFAMQRSFLGGLAMGAASKPVAPLAALSTVNGAVAARRPRARTQELIDLALKAISEHPADQYTFPEIKATLAQQGHHLTRDELRRIMEAVVGRAPVFQVSPRAGSAPGIYSKVPVAGNGTPLDQSEFTISRNGHSSPMEDQT